MTGTDENLSAPRRVRGAGYDMNLSVGQRCLIQFEIDGQKFKAQIIGLEQYSFIIARLPLVPGIQNRMRQGRPVIIRLEQAGTLYGFTTEIIASNLKPAPFVVLAYPGSVEGLRYRRYKRTRCMLPAEIVNDALNSEGFITDISLGGCRVIIDWRERDRAFAVTAGDSMELRMLLDGKAPQAVPARLMNLQSLKRHYTLGLKFEVERVKPLDRFITRLEGAWAAMEGA